MTPPASEADDAKKAKPPRTSRPDVPKFLTQLFDILEAESSAVIKWADDGTAVQIIDPARVTNEILPKYFSHNNFQSFQRQLNYFGFRKWTKTKTYICTFSHPYFRRNERDKLHWIKRKSVPKRSRVKSHMQARSRYVPSKPTEDISKPAFVVHSCSPPVPQRKPPSSSMKPNNQDDAFKAPFLVQSYAASLPLPMQLPTQLPQALAMPPPMQLQQSLPLTMVSSKRKYLVSSAHNPCAIQPYSSDKLQSRQLQFVDPSRMNKIRSNLMLRLGVSSKRSPERAHPISSTSNSAQKDVHDKVDADMGEETASEAAEEDGDHCVETEDEALKDEPMEAHDGQGEKAPAEAQEASMIVQKDGEGASIEMKEEVEEKSSAPWASMRPFIPNDSDDPVNLLLGIKKASPLVLSSVPPTPLPSETSLRSATSPPPRKTSSPSTSLTKVRSLEAQLTEARLEIARLQASLQLQLEVNQRLRESKSYHV
ncbi:DnaJ sub C member 7 [Aphanomyces cochlioides]|nr:DnaJ sub C member 7 [Aphanomyces cochlioides]